MKDIRFHPINDYIINEVINVSIDGVYLSILYGIYGYELFYHNVWKDFNASIYGDLEYLIKRMHHYAENLQ
jgi:hypothetical protein